MTDYPAHIGFGVVSVPADVIACRLLGYHVAGDGGAKDIVRVASEPTHLGKVRSADTYLPDGSTDATNGGWWELSDQPVNVKMFGARFDNSTDDRAAIQDAVDYTSTIGCELRWPRGFGQISGPINVTTRVQWAGQGKHFTFMVAQTGFTGAAMVQFPPLTTDSNDASLSIISGVSLSGGGLAAKGFSGATNHVVLEKLRITGTTQAGVDFYYGWCNYFHDLRVDNCTGVGIRLGNVYGEANANSITDCSVIAITGVGIEIDASNHVDLRGNTVEACSVAGIVVNMTKSVTIASNYFEANGATGYTFTTPPVTVKADVIINGSATAGTMSVLYPSSVVVRDNFVSAVYVSSFVYAPGAEMLVVDGNKSHGAVAPVLVGCYGSPGAFPTYGYLQNMQIGANVGFAGVDVVVEPISANVLYYSMGAPNTHKRSASQRNLAVKALGSWVNVASGNGGTWGVSTTKFPGDPNTSVYNLAYAASGSSHTYGFTINAALYPEHWGKMMVFSVWTKHSFAGNGNAALMANSTFITQSNSSETTWRIQSGLFKMPTTGTLLFGMKKTGVSGTIQVACPVLCELGADMLRLMDAQ